MSASYQTTLHQHFDAVASAVLGQVAADEALTLNLTAEDTLYVRFNHGKVRQNTDVRQAHVALVLQAQGRSMERVLTLSGNLPSDQALLAQALQACRAEAQVLRADPNQVPVQNHGSSQEVYSGQLPDVASLVQTMATSTQGMDFTGLYVGGEMVRASRNSAGQNHWFATQTFQVDYSLYDGPKAAKSGYSGSQWNTQDWQADLTSTHHLLQQLQRPKVDVKPGRYRTYLAPKAFADLVGMLGWNALSAAAYKQGRSPFKKLKDGQASLSAQLHISENFGLGLSPRFNHLGEVSAAQLPLIDQGQLRTLLTNSRTAKEHGLQHNAAAEDEAPRSLDVACGNLAQADVLKALGTGLYLSNLHYLNWSDPVAARVTGMTRYACFWVEGGEIVGPIHDLRWDESLYDALGQDLLALTDSAELQPSSNTYYARCLGGCRVPGALIEAWNYTL